MRCAVAGFQGNREPGGGWRERLGAAAGRRDGSTFMQDISRHVSEADIRRLLPLQKAVTALEYDIKETALAVAEVRCRSARCRRAARAAATFREVPRTPQSHACVPNAHCYRITACIALIASCMQSIGMAACSTSGGLHAGLPSTLPSCPLHIATLAPAARVKAHHRGTRQGPLAQTTAHPSRSTIASHVGSTTTRCEPGWCATGCRE